MAWSAGCCDPMIPWPDWLMVTDRECLYWVIIPATDTRHHAPMGLETRAGNNPSRSLTVPWEDPYYDLSLLKAPGRTQQHFAVYLHFILILHFTQIQHFLRHLFLPSQLPARQNKYFSLGGGEAGEAAWNICENLFPAPKAEQTCFVLHHTTWVLPAKQLNWVPAKEMVTSTLNIMLENFSCSGEFLGCY